ncbi:unnamed protein product [Polarella glacialis]|uniref:Uncharacterized protein n=1 Tax=Polarella glacialis TaxID=89957 RepID=A0A813JMA5_POLGL|nr:unnamed protein product [Polarella glacialis]
MDEDLGWLSQLNSESAYDGLRFIIYTKGSHDLSDQISQGMLVHRLPNVGRESHTYIQHIVANYDQLAEWTVFSQAGEPSFGYRGHRQGGGHLLAGDSFANYLVPNPSGARFVYTSAVQLPSMHHLLRAGYCINDTTLEGDSFGACPKEASQWTSWLDVGSFHDYISAKVESQDGESAMDFYRKYINPAADGITGGGQLVIPFSQGARFAVSRSKIRSRPKDVYERLLNTLSRNEDPYSGYFMEWMWSELFLGHQEPCRMPPTAAKVMSHSEALAELAQRYTIQVERLLGEAASTERAVIYGGLNLAVPDCEIFFETGLALVLPAAIATAGSVTENYIAVEADCGYRRRLSTRRLLETVYAAYEITIPAGSTYSADSVVKALQGQTLAGMSSLVIAELKRRGLTYAGVEVKSLSAPVIVFGTATTTKPLQKALTRGESFARRCGIRPAVLAALLACSSLRR